jgi:hypothetical protein
MRPRSLSLLLLICLALRLGAGPHPCHARTMPAAPAGPASCHGMPAPAQEPAHGQEREKDDCCDPRTGDHSLCEQGCQRAAVLGGSLVLPLGRPFEEQSPSPEQGSPSPPAFPIDHVPLG